MKRFDSPPRLELGWSEGAAPRGSTAAAGVSVRRWCCRTGEGVGSGGGGRLGGWVLGGCPAASFIDGQGGGGGSGVMAGGGKLAGGF